MRVAVYERYGPPEVLHIEEVARPVPLEGEVLVRVLAAIVSRSDVATREANRRSGLLVTIISRVISGVRGPKQRILGSEFAVVGGKVAVDDAGSGYSSLQHIL